LRNTLKKIDAMQTALERTPASPGDLDQQLHQLRQDVLALDGQLNGNRTRRQVGEKTNPTINSRIGFAIGSTRHSTYGPTPNIEKSFEIAYAQFAELKTDLQRILDQQLGSGGTRRLGAASDPNRGHWGLECAVAG
jgi:hypothetical protein